MSDHNRSPDKLEQDMGAKDKRTLLVCWVQFGYGTPDDLIGELNTT